MITQRQKGSPPARAVKYGADNLSKTTHSVTSSGAGAGVLRAPRQALDAGRYKKRLQQNKEYPNKRKKIITGKDLTTPLARKKEVERTQSERAKSKQIDIEKKTVPKAAKKLPINTLFGLAIGFIVFLSFLWSQGIVNGQNKQINEWNAIIQAEKKEQARLENELEKKNDLNFIKTYAVEELGMVRKESLEKHYISGKRHDRAEVVKAGNRAIVDLPDIMSAIMGKPE